MAGTFLQEERARFASDGILFPIPVLSEVEVRRYRAALDELRDCLGGNVARLPSCHLYFQWAHDLALHPRVLAAVAEIVGPDVFIWGTLIMAKAPHSAAYISWHQDGAYASYLNGAPAVSAWIALSDSSVESGCMRVLAGTHKQAVKHAERVDRDNMLIYGQTVEATVDESKAVDVVLQAGEMSLHDLNIIHGSNPNVSDHDRIGFIVRFAGRGTERGTQVLRGKEDGGYECTNLFRRPAEPLTEEVLQSYKELLDSPDQRHRARAD
jgi:non-haem Fe2+, alpha-ketoglutarate-dependent halogenase